MNDMAYSSEPVIAIDQWFERMCDNDWEHQGGITIQTTDNPGWVIIINLDDIIIDKDAALRLLNNDDAHVEAHYFPEKNTYHVFCEPLNLEKALRNAANILKGIN